MRPVAGEFATPATRKAARHLGKLVREARLARRMPQTELATRARTSPSTVIRMEKGSLETALGTWLSVMEHVGLLKEVESMRDPTSEALLAEHKAKRARRSRRTDLDF